MKKTKRHEEMLAAITEKGSISVSSLVLKMPTSEATIRRDLSELEKQNRIIRTHGNISISESISGRLHPSFIEKLNVKSSEKNSVAANAASLINPGDTIFISSGSTTHKLISHIRDIPNLTVITNALNIANSLLNIPYLECILIGGMLRKDEMSLIGYIAEKLVKELRADKIFISTEGINFEKGLTNSYLPETLTDQAILKMSPKIIMMADHDKFQNIKTSCWAPVSIINTLITDNGTSKEILAPYRDQGINVIVVTPDS